ncbi:hypothetical protein NQZ68_038962 [Dissostichus eleginoides]|nr:hypothetical protein NQZ68_038962 [Dissostichus eleginoides]
MQSRQHRAKANDYKASSETAAGLHLGRGPAQQHSLRWPPPISYTNHDPGPSAGIIDDQLGLLILGPTYSQC